VGAVGITLAYGLLTEVLQAHVFVGRYGNVYDFYADSIGAFCGWFMFSLIYRKKIKTFSNTNQD
jgi:VanZ family protein